MKWLSVCFWADSDKAWVEWVVNIITSEYLEAIHQAKVLRAFREWGKETP